MSSARWTPKISVKDFHLFHPVPGCYAFYYKGKLVYIGSATYIRKRLRQHRTNGALKKVDTIRLRVDRRYMEHLTHECRLIRRLKPERNCKYKTIGLKDVHGHFLADKKWFKEQ